LFSDPPLNIVGIEKRDGSVQYARRRAGAGIWTVRQGLATAPIGSASAATNCEVANGIAGRHGFTATVTVTEITGSESSCISTAMPPTGSPCCRAYTKYPPGHVLDAVLDPNNVFVFDAADRLVAAPGAM